MIMPFQPVNGPDWTVVLTSLWKREDAKGFLSNPPPKKWPVRGPLSKLLDSTIDICSSAPIPFAEDPKAARQAVKSEIVPTLTQIICWLQQHPSYGLHGGAGAEVVWGALANVVRSVTGTLTSSTEASDRALVTRCMEQLMQSPGALVA